MSATGADAGQAATPPAKAPRQLRMVRPHLDHLPPLEVPAGYQLRPFQPGDERAWGAIMEVEDGVGRGWTEEKVHRQLLDQPQFEPAGLFFATADSEDGRPVASACAWRRAAEERTLGNLHMVSSLPAHRGRGLGRLVCLAVLHYMHVRGFSLADLSTDDARLAAIKTYLALGFVPHYLPDPEGTDDHQVRWSAVFTRLGAQRQR